MKSLETFSIGEYIIPKISKSSLEKIYHYFDRMPNLKFIRLNCVCGDINIEIYNKFIIKLLSLKLDYLDLNIIKNEDSQFNKERYSLEELKAIFPSTNCNNLDRIRIFKIE